MLGYWTVPGFVGTTLLASCSLSLRNVLFSKGRVEKARSMRSNRPVQVVSGISSVRSTVVCSIPSGNKKHKTLILVNCALVKTCKNVLLQINWFLPTMTLKKLWELLRDVWRCVEEIYSSAEKFIRGRKTPGWQGEPVVCQLKPNLDKSAFWVPPKTLATFLVQVNFLTCLKSLVWLKTQSFVLSHIPIPFKMNPKRCVRMALFNN